MLSLRLVLLLSFILTLAASAHEQDLVDGITTCFDRLAVKVDTYVEDNESCRFNVQGDGDGEAMLVTDWYDRNELMSSTLYAYTRTWAESFRLEPTNDPRTYRINPIGPVGTENFVLPIAGGVYAYVYFSGADAHMVRCNKTILSCVIYVDIAEYTRRVLQTSSPCFVIFMLSFPEPEQDEQIAKYMNSVLEFTKRSVRPVDLERFRPACADHRPGERG